MSQEYEIISHDRGSYRLFLVNMIYRTPHIHLDFEFLLVLNGKVTVNMPAEQLTLSKGDLCIINPIQSHEFHASAPALLLSLQIPPAYFTSVYPETDHLEFKTGHLKNNLLQSILLHLAAAHFRNGKWDELYCCSLVFRFFYELLHNTIYEVKPDHSWKQAARRGDRLRRILDYIDRHYGEKITLQDIADSLGVSTYYLSHYFKDAMGISIQKCIMRFRCEEARRLLLTTDASVLDISLTCGFSDPKYFTRSFRDQYGMRPGEYRKAFRKGEMREQQSSMLSTQEFLSDEASMVMLDRFIKDSF